MALSAGRLRHRVDIMRQVPVDNDKGGYTMAWAPVAQGVRAEVVGLTGSEAVLEKILQGVRVYRITMRWRELRPKDQIRYGGEDLNIRSAVDSEGRRRTLVIIADTASAIRTS